MAKGRTQWRLAGAANELKVEKKTFVIFCGMKVSWF